jgi:hypothetical protein
MMFVVSEEEAAAIRAAFDRGGEFAAASELRRRFPGISNNEQARQCAKAIAGWKSVKLPLRPPAQLRKIPKSLGALATAVGRTTAKLRPSVPSTAKTGNVANSVSTAAAPPSRSPHCILPM